MAKRGVCPQKSGTNAHNIGLKPSGLSMRGKVLSTSPRVTQGQYIERRERNHCALHFLGETSTAIVNLGRVMDSDMQLQISLHGSKPLLKGSPWRPGPHHAPRILQSSVIGTSLIQRK